MKTAGQCAVGVTDGFKVGMGLHQGSALLVCCGNGEVW